MEKTVVYAGVAIVAIVVILVVAGSAIANNSTSSMSIPTNSINCEEAPFPPLMRNLMTGEVNPEYTAWKEKWGTCPPLEKTAAWGGIKY
jgi:hypothetical protein